MTRVVAGRRNVLEMWSAAASMQQLLTNSRQEEVLQFTGVSAPVSLSLQNSWTPQL